MEPASDFGSDLLGTHIKWFSVISSGALDRRKEEGMQVVDPTEIAIKYNILPQAGPCAICSGSVAQERGPALFLASSYDRVCWSCAERYAPEMADMLKAWRKTQE